MFITAVLFLSLNLNLNHWLLEKSEMINLQMLIRWRMKKHAQQCLLRFFWCRYHFGTCESLGSLVL